MATNEITLTDVGRQLKIASIEMAARAGSGHPTSSMSAADLIGVLITRHLRIDPRRPDTPGNDRLLFSKGHASPLLYAALAMCGVLENEELESYRQPGSRLEGHPTPSIPGVVAATGSLGLGLPIAVGLAIAARDLDRTDARTWVLCGDSEMTEGSVAEAIDYAGWAGLSGLKAIVDVNRLGQTGPTRHQWDLDHYAHRFEVAGWQSIVIDGHDTEAIDEAFTTAAESDRPTAIIARTHKGSGASESDDESGKHGKPLDDPEAAIEELGGRRTITVTPPTPPSWSAEDAAGDDIEIVYERPSWSMSDEIATRDAFGEAIAALATSDRRLVALDAEVGDSTRLERANDAAPDRFYQMYIAEQLQFAAAIGLDAAGWTPVVSTFGAFATRAHDMLRMAAVGGTSMTVVGSHAGVSIGPDGPSQMALEDVAMMRALHGSTVVHPCDPNQTAQLLEQLLDRPGIAYLRTLRGTNPVIHPDGTRFTIGGSAVIDRSDSDVATIVAAGATVPEAIEAAGILRERGTAVRVIDAYSIKPIDEQTLRQAAQETGRMVVVEDHRPEGGLGEAVLSALAGAHIDVDVIHLAVRSMPGSATPSEQRALAGIDAAAIIEAVEISTSRV